MIGHTSVLTTVDSFIATLREDSVVLRNMRSASRGAGCGGLLGANRGSCVRIEGVSMSRLDIAYPILLTTGPFFNGSKIARELF